MMFSNIYPQEPLLASRPTVISLVTFRRANGTSSAGYLARRLRLTYRLAMILVLDGISSKLMSDCSALPATTTRTSILLRSIAAILGTGTARPRLRSLRGRSNQELL